MKSITSSKFMRGVAGTDDMLADGVPQIAFIGRSNVGKSSVINSLTHEDDLARTSDTPGMTQQINIYWINKSIYLLDLPGYGYAKASWKVKDRLQKLIYWYFFDSPYSQKKVVLIIDANVGLTKDDLAMLVALRQQEKKVVIVANKIDKIKKSEFGEKIAEIQSAAGDIKIVAYSAKKGTGKQELTEEILG